MIQAKDCVMLAAIFGAMLAGIAWPQAWALLSPYPMFFMMLLLFLSFLPLPLESLLKMVRGYGLRLFGWLLLKLIILPTALFYAARATFPEYALAALLLGGISTGVTSPFFSTLLRANTALVVLMVAAGSVLVPFTLPLLVRALADQTLIISLPAMMRLLAQVIIAPLVAAELLRYFSARTAERISRFHYPLSLVLCAAIMLGVTPRYADFFYRTPSVILEALLVSAILAASCFVVGVLAAIRQPLDDRLAVVISFGIINNILVVVFSSEFFGPIEPLVAMVYTVPFFCSILFLRAYALWSKAG